jgi:hypothetical protein
MFGTGKQRLVRLAVPGEEGEIHDFDIPGHSVLEKIEKRKSGGSKKRKTEGEGAEDPSENDASLKDKDEREG